MVVFFSYKIEDEAKLFGTETRFEITEITGDLNKAEILRSISSAARKFDANTYKVLADPHNVGSARVVFSFVGDPIAHRALMGDGNYPYFSASYKTTVLPFEAITAQDVRGAYSTTADLSTTTRMLAELADAGVTAVVDQENLTNSILDEIIASPLFVIILAALAALVLSLVYGTVSQRKMHTIKLVHGYGNPRILAADLAAFCRFYGIAAGAALAVSGIFLTFYNDLHQITSFGINVASAVIMLFAFVAVLHIVAFIVQSKPRVARTLKGQRPLAFVGVVSIAVQAAALLLLFGTLSDGARLLVSAQADERQKNGWLAAKDFVTLRISPTTTEDDFQSLMGLLGNFVRDEEARGNAVMSDHPYSSTPDDYSFSRGNRLIVNNQFLNAQPVFSSSGQRIEELPDANGQLYLLVPESARFLEATITADFQEFVAFQRGQSPHFDSHSETTITVVYTRDGQEIFNYGGLDLMRETSQRDPVIAVMPAASNVLSDDFYASIITGGSILFADADAVSQTIRRGGLEKYILSVDTASDYALAELDKQQGELRAYAVSILLVFSVLLLASSILALIYCDKNKHALFVKHILGWTFLKTHGRYLFGNLIGGATLLLASTGAQTVATGVGFTAAMTPLLANLLFTCAIVKTNERRFRGDFIKRY
jgi:putative ABC transport system permease protein